MLNAGRQLTIWQRSQSKAGSGPEGPGPRGGQPRAFDDPESPGHGAMGVSTDPERSRDTADSPEEGALWAAANSTAQKRPLEQKERLDFGVKSQW